MRIPFLVLLVAATAAVVAVGFAMGEDDPGPAPGDPRPPVVVVVFDEFPTDTLLKPDGEIDAERFPNFAALARTSTWFPNGQTVYDSTFKAVPAILDARLPRPRTAADVRSHQPSVFHLMHRHGYGVIKVESGSAVCPPWICLGARTRRPGVLRRLAGSGRPARLHRWIGAIRERERPTFYFHHALLPHEPWLYLPSGHQSRPPGRDPIPGINRPIGFHDPGLTDHNHLRHLLQVGYVDRQLGLILRRLRRTKLFDRAILMVVADHGYSFELDVPEPAAGDARPTSTRSPPCPSSSRRRARPRARWTTASSATSTWCRRSPTCSTSRCSWQNDGYSVYSEVTRRRATRWRCRDATSAA